MSGARSRRAAAGNGAAGSRARVSSRTLPPMFALMLVDTPDDRYRGPERGTPWRRVLRLLAAAVVLFVAGATVLPWVGFLLDIGSVVLVLLALCALDD